MDVKSCIYAFRLQETQLFLYYKDVLWTLTACAILLDRHLFLMKLEDMQYLHLSFICLELHLFMRRRFTCGGIL